MKESLITQYIQPLVQRNLFSTDEDALKELLESYILNKINTLSNDLNQFEKKHQMNYSQFQSFVKKESLSFDANPKLGVALMDYEDDLLEWKAKKEILESWLGFSKGIN